MGREYGTYWIVVFSETSGNGVGRVIEASGSSEMAGTLFGLLRYIHVYIGILCV